MKTRLDKKKELKRLDRRTKDRILELYFPTDGSPSLNCVQILDRLMEENEQNANGEQYFTPTSARPYQKFIKDYIERETEPMKLERQPWSLVLNEKGKIPFDPILFELLKAWFERQRQRGQEPPFIPFPVGLAKWAVRLYKMAPYLVEKDEKGLPCYNRLFNKARRYFAKEHIAVLAGKLPDSTDEDLELIMIDPEIDPKLKVDFEKMRRYKVIKLKGEEVQTENGERSEIIVPANKAERIVTKKKKQRKIK